MSPENTVTVADRLASTVRRIKRAGSLVHRTLSIAATAVVLSITLCLAGAPAISPERAKELVGKEAEQVVAVLAAKNLSKLAPYVDPVKGVRFSPYAQVDTDADVVLHRADLESPAALQKIRKWGAYDGSGDPIRGSVARYAREFVYDRDYAHTKHIGYNQSLAKGNTASNIAEVYPDSIYVEFYVEPVHKNTEQDWHALRLVFAQRGQTWFLVGIIHDQWTV